jgi:hypothetical protein
MASKKLAAVVAEVTEEPTEPPAEQSAAVEPQEVVQPITSEPRVEVAPRKPLPAERRCPSHAKYFPDEPEMRPIAEFRINKEGHIHPVYCKRCTSKRNIDYRKAKAAGQSAAEPSAMTLFFNGLRQDVSEILNLVDVGDDAQLTELSAVFADKAVQRVIPLLRLYATRRSELPEKVYDQHGIEVE